MIAEEETEKYLEIACHSFYYHISTIKNMYENFLYNGGFSPPSCWFSKEEEITIGFVCFLYFYMPHTIKKILNKKVIINYEIEKHNTENICTNIEGKKLFLVKITLTILPAYADSILSEMHEYIKFLEKIQSYREL